MRSTQFRSTTPKRRQRAHRNENSGTSARNQRHGPNEGASGGQAGNPSAAALRGKPHAELSDTRQMAQDLGENTVGKAMLSLLKKNDSLTFGCKTGGISLRCR
jgi:hypothetical protein